jgi:hypothetical protein
VLPKQLGRFPELAEEPAMIVAVCRRCHNDHEARSRPLPRGALPPVTIDFARADARYWYWLTRLYPER